MAKVKLNVAAYMHKNAHEGRFERFKSGFTRQRLPKGTVVETLSGSTDSAGMTRVKIVLLDQDQLGVSIGGWREGDVGYVRTAKLQLDSLALMEKAAISRPDLNGIGGSVGQWGASSNDVYLDEIALNLEYWEAIGDILNLCLAREEHAGVWGPRVKRLGRLQILGGAAMIGLSLGAVIVTGGAAAPLLLAFGITAGATGVIGVGTAGAKGKLLQGTGLSGDGRWEPYKQAGQATVITGTVTAAKAPTIQAVVNATVSGPANQAATTALANAGAGAIGGGFNMYGGASAIKLADKVNPVAAWSAVDWQQVMSALTGDYIRITEEMESVPYVGQDAKETMSYMVRENNIKIARTCLDKTIRKLARALSESKNWHKGAAAPIKTAGSLDRW